MRTRYWVCILGVLFALLGAVCLLAGRPGQSAQVLCDGEPVMTIPLGKDGVYPIETPWGTNVVEVRNGSLGVVSATCPGQDCVHMGFRAGGSPIVCLPNRLVIHFPQGEELDGISG